MSNQGSEANAGDLPPASPLLAQLGPQPETAVVAFSARGGGLGGPGFDFDGVTERLGYSRVLLRDDSHACFVNGIPGLAPSCEALVALLRATLDKLAPRKTIFTGPSGAGHAAILYGHLLKADYVHAFAPYTRLDPDHVLSLQDDESVAREARVIAALRALPDAAKRNFDLCNFLRTWNGVTRYNIYVCERSAYDVTRAERLQDMQGVNIHRQPCGTHRIVTWLAGRQQILPLLRAETQEYIANFVEPRRIKPDVL
jgi:hypothetical protein